MAFTCLLGLATTPPGAPSLWNNLSSGNNIADGFLGNCCWTFALFLVGFSIALVWRYTTVAEHQRLLQFIGIVRGRPHTTIFTSRLEIRRWRAGEVDPPTVGVTQLTKGYRGPAINLLEYQAAVRLQRSITRMPLAWVSRRLLDMWNRLHFRFRLTEPEVKVSPSHGMDEADAAAKLANIGQYTPLTENAILIGNGMYNLHSYRIGEENTLFLPFLTFSRDGLWSPTGNPDDSHPLAVRCWTRRGEKTFGCDWVQGRAYSSGPRELFVVQRLSRKPDGSAPPVTVILCAGTCSMATVAAVLYLIDNWHLLAARFSDRDFAVCYAASVPNPDDRDAWPTDAIRWYEIGEACDQRT